MTQAIDTAWVSKILNASLPVGTSGVPGTAVTALNAGTMFIALTSTSNSTGTGTQLANGNGYTTNGIAFTATGTAAASSAGSNVVLPVAGDASTFLWTNTSGGWTINGLNVTDHVQLRTFFGNFNGAPITIAALNSFQIATGAITISLT